MQGCREEGRTEGPATMRHMARARPEQHAMQFSCRLHHQSVLARSRVHRARELPGRLSLSFSLPLLLLVRLVLPLHFVRKCALFPLPPVCPASPPPPPSVLCSVHLRYSSYRTRIFGN